MKRILFSLVLAAISASPALADKAAYCQAYARDFSDQSATDKAMWQHKYQIALDACLAQHQQSPKTAATKAQAPKAAVAAKPAPAPAKVKPASLGLVAGTPEWNDYCTKKYTSFNVKTGMYQSKTGVPRKCMVTSDFKG